FAPTPGSDCSSDRCAPRPETIPRLACRVLAPPGLALIAIPALRKLRLRRRIGLRMARTRHQPAQLYPMQQPVGARQTAINLKLLFKYAWRVDPTKRHHPVPLQYGAGDHPFLEPRAGHRVHPGLSTRARPVTQSLNAVLFIAVMPYISRRPAQPSQPRRFLMLHPLEHVRDHQNPLADTPALVSCQAPQLGRPRFAAKEVCRHRPSPKHGTLSYQLYHWGSPEAGITHRWGPFLSRLPNSCLTLRWRRQVSSEPVSERPKFPYREFCSSGP